MNAVSSKTFKSGNSVALRLPKSLAIEPDIEMTIEKNGDVLTVRPLLDPAEEKRKLIAFLDEMAALPRPPSVQKREPFEFPERPGL